MIAKVEKHNDEFIATFERHINHPKVNVWEMLTQNDRLSLWFDELRVAELKKGGYLTFNMGDGSFERMDIIDFEEQSIIEFTWDDNLVRFELIEESGGCNLVLIERINEITEQTMKDLAGWHVCLDVIISILDGEKIEDRMEDWKVWYEKYRELLLPLS
ncbi:SRPBCC family protein [Ornithinibacillus sp. 179-J 7C1 HS]|uniref:SRPBCC family protein n=1 Tax=Ornithinibacillus sp. 179-J 7C1 HS TaxID=3142384 RepID=UPI0039A3A6E3